MHPGIKRVTTVLSGKPPIFDMEMFTLEAIAENMKNLSPSISCGVDGIAARLLKATGPSIYPIILHVCNVIISSKTFPDCWKIASITPLGNTTDPNNLKPNQSCPV